MTVWNYWRGLGGVAHWQKQAIKIIEFHEAQNAPPETEEEDE